MRVLHLLTAIGPGGAEVWLLNMLRTMDRRECAMDFCLKWPEAANQSHVAVELGAQVHVNRLGPTHVGYVTGLRRILREGRYDVVHSHEFVYSGIGVWVARRLGLPVVCTFHHYLSRPEASFLRVPGLREMRAAYGKVSLAYAMRNATFVSALSRKVTTALWPSGAPQNYRRLTLSSDLPAPLDERQRAAVRRDLGVEPDARLILHVGRFIEQKNHAGVLDVFSRVFAREPQARLLLLGQGPLRDEVLARVRALGLTDAVRYLGTRNDVQRIMTASDVFLFPSRDEGFGLAALEANAAGLPVVGANVAGLDEAVENDVTARLHAVDDVDSMASSVLDFLRDDELAARFGGAGQHRARTEYSHEAAARRLRALYEECLRAPH